MKNLIPVIASGVLLLASGCVHFSNRGTVENPYIESATTGALSFEKIELSDSSTVLHGVVHFRPGYWIRISSKSAIVADVSPTNHRPYPHILTKLRKYVACIIV